MRKKQANLFCTSPKISEPPYMTADELRQFKNQFSLFHTELDLSKLKEQISAGSETMKYIDMFVNDLDQKHKVIDFQLYIKQLVGFLKKQDQADFMTNVLGGEQQLLDRSLIKQIIEQTMDRDLSAKEESEIMGKIFEGDKDAIGMDKIIEILAQARDRI